MKEKFVRTSEHTKISDIEVNHNPEYTKQNLENLKAIANSIKKMREDSIENGVETLDFADIQMADGSEYSDITINNAHKHL